jgi:hypothetical protein
MGNETVSFVLMSGVNPTRPSVRRRATRNPRPVGAECISSHPGCPGERGRRIVHRLCMNPSPAAGASNAGASGGNAAVSRRVNRQLA